MNVKILKVFGLLVFGFSIYAQKPVIVGAERPEAYLTLIKSKRIGLVVNHTSTVKNQHLVDFLLKNKIKINIIFAPEHGFRGEVSAGDHIKNSVDSKTGLTIKSLYGKDKKPSKVDLKNIDVVIFDIQDVGLRFYTYISTLYYVMEACSENKKTLLILDRPNPNGHYSAGPILDLKEKSFVGMYPVPVVHGMTVGELATMTKGEKWIKGSLDLKVIKSLNYSHSSPYNLPIKPSPNLPNNTAIGLYASLCLLEPTEISVGRGTDLQFQVLGGPHKNYGDYSFTPIDKPGAINPVNKGIISYGLDLSKEDGFAHRFTLKYLWDFYQKSPQKTKFFSSESFFNKLIGNSWVLEDLKNNLPYLEVEKKWQTDLEKFNLKRKKYLLYK